jgi:uncharacterized protein (TIGR01244 family)
MGPIRIRASASLIAALVTLSPSVVAADREAGTPSRRTVDISTIDIDNFGRVDEHLYRGEQPDARDYADLAALGIKTVIDLQADGDNLDEARLVEAAGMTFVRIPMTTHVPPTPEQLAQFLAIVIDPARLPVYVHCKGGKHRTGVMSAVYRMERDGWTADQAFQEMKRYKFGWDFLHPEFKRFVYAYVRGLLAQPAAGALDAPSK